MGFINIILDLAALLIWLKWRTTDLVTSVARPDRSLLSTLKRAEAVRQPRWLLPGTLAALLAIRSVFYWNIGSAVDWVPSLHLVVIAPHFRSDAFGLMVAFSLLSFGLMLIVYHLCLLLLSVVNPNLPEHDPLQKLVRYQLGFVDRWPLALKLVLPFVVGTLVWVVLTDFFARLGIIPLPLSTFQRWEQAMVMGLTCYLVWKALIVAFLLLHMVNSYVYLGNQAFWHYLDRTSQNLLRPLRVVPLRVMRVDFSPLVGAVLLFLLGHFVTRKLTVLYEHLPH